MTAPSDPAALAAEVRAAAARPGARRTLLLDLDGTLAPIAPTPEAVRVPPPTLAALARLAAAGWRVAVVSGRPAAEVRVLVPVRGIACFGSHGREGRWPGAVRPPGVPAAVRRRLAAVARRAGRLARAVRGARVERKPCGVALHDRGVAPADLPRWRRAVRDLLEGSDLEGLERLPGRRVLELRPGGVDKGTVVEALPGGLPARRDRSVVAIGDDATDEDLYRALGGKGLAVRVGRRAAGGRDGRRLASPAAVGRFLSALAATGPSAPPRSRAPR